MQPTSPEKKAQDITGILVGKYHKKILAWFYKNGRKFPWRGTKNPYKILISEILLQKTNSRAVGIVYESFIKKYPTPMHVTKSSKGEIFKIVSSLGLYYRAERIFEICKSLVEDHGGEIPNNLKELMALKGVGRYAASAVLCFGFDQKEAIIDQNVIRILSRVFEIISNKPRPHYDGKLWQAAQYLLPEKNFQDYNFALLDLSALVCKPKPLCETCPLKDFCCFKNK